MTLTGKVAVVTGSGQGLGLVYAQDLARHGAAVVVNDVNPDAATSAVAAITATGGRAAPVGSTETAQALVAADDAASLISFLASADVAHITGQAFSIGGDRLALWSHQQLTATGFHDGGWSADDIAAQWADSFAASIESVGEEFPEELTAR